jgi:hypothetical protein
MPKETKQEAPSNAQLIAENFPASVYPYLLDTASLMASKHSLFMEAKSKSISPDTIIISEKDPEAPLIVLHNDTTRGLRIDNQPVRQLSKAEIIKHIHKIFPEDASAILRHYSQVAAYFVYSPLLMHFIRNHEESVLKFPIPAKTRHDNLFNSNGVTLRETSETHIHFRVVPDTTFLMTDKKKQLKKMPLENTEERNRLKTKWLANWRLKYNIKILNRVRPEGFEIVAIGTDSALISNMLMDIGNPLQQLKDIVFKIREMEKSMKELHKSLRMKADFAKESSNPEREKNSSDKAEIVKLVLHKIIEFKSGEITFEMLVKNLDEFHQLSRIVKKAGFLSKLKSKLSEAEESPTAQKIGGFVSDLTAIKANIESIASSTLQAAPVVNVKNNIHASIRDTLAVVQFYINNRDENLSLTSMLFFDSDRGKFRAQSYTNLLEAAQAELSRAIIISALLKGGGSELRSVVAQSFGTEDIHKVQSDLMNLILQYLQNEFVLDTVGKVIDSIVTKVESNKLISRDDFKEELLLLSSFEKMEKPEVSLSNRPAPR